MFHFREVYYRFLIGSQRGRKGTMMFGLVTQVIHMADKQPHGVQRHFRERVKKFRISKKAFSSSGQHTEGKQKRENEPLCLSEEGSNRWVESEPVMVLE